MVAIWFFVNVSALTNRIDRLFTAILSNGCTKSRWGDWQTKKIDYLENWSKISEWGDYSLGLKRLEYGLDMFKQDKMIVLAKLIAIVE